MKVRGFALRGWQIALLAVATAWQTAWTWALIRWALTQPSGGLINTVANGVAALALFSTPPIVLVTIVIATTGRRDKSKTSPTPDKRGGLPSGPDVL
jgi:hypothetical protein